MEKSNLLQAFEKHQELDSIITALVEKFEPLQIICFSKTENIEISKGCFKDFKETTAIHYHLLMITENPSRIEHSVQDYLNSHFAGITITILVHGNERVQELISERHHFYCSVYSSGQLLYNKDGLFIATSIRQADPKKTYDKALVYFNARYAMAKAFHNSASSALEAEDCNVAMFLMHQAIEQACRALVSVHLSYKSDIHNVERLLRLTLCFSDEPSLIFRRKTKEDMRLFQILQSCYSLARYVDSYSVELNDAYKIMSLVDDFLKAGEVLCCAHLEKLKAELTLAN